MALPEFLPIGSVYGVGIGDPDRREPDGRRDVSDEPPLITLLSRALLLFALDYERGAKLSLAVQLDGLRVLDADGVAVRDLPRLTGVSKEAIAMIVNRLERVGCVDLVPIPGRGRGKHARLTAERGVRPEPPGAAARARADELARAVRRRRGIRAAASARADRRRRHARGLAAVRRARRRIRTAGARRCPTPELLPWFPMLLHRGGYPDGS